MEKYRLSLFRPLDLFSVLAFLALAVVLIAAPFRADGYIRHLMLVHGTETTELSWKKQTIDLQELIGKDMTIEVEPDRARVLHSDCPDQVCIHRSWISACGDMAACLPNGVAIYVDCRALAKEDLNVTEP